MRIIFIEALKPSEYRWSHLENPSLRRQKNETDRQVLKAGKETCHRTIPKKKGVLDMCQVAAVKTQNEG